MERVAHIREKSLGVKLREGERLEDLNVDGKVITKINFKKMGWESVDRSMCLRIEISARPV
jgi:hypothetical protein